MDEALDFREAQKRLQFVDATVNLAADYFDRVRTPALPSVSPIPKLSSTYPMTEGVLILLFHLLEVLHQHAGYDNM